MKTKLLLSFLLITSLSGFRTWFVASQITNDAKGGISEQQPLLQGHVLQATNMTVKFSIGESDSGRRLGHSGKGGGSGGGKGGGGRSAGGGSTSLVREPHAKRNSSPSTLSSPILILSLLFFPLFFLHSLQFI